ncbi:MAG: HAD family hydrolase [Patescibacteria group bacterium]|nr:HAD family hydrolase [Patescibacteria group bacterium]
MLTVLWDNDGVLVDTEGLYFQACREVLASVGVDLTLEAFKEISLRRGESVFQLASQGGMEAEEVARLRNQRDHRYGDLLSARCPVNEGVADALHALHGRVCMGVVTSSRRGHFEAAHARSGVVQYMSFVLTREDYTHTKPHPEPYLTAMERHNLRPEQCIAVEDSERGLAAAVAAGLACIVVASRWTGNGDFTKAVARVDTMAEVASEILRRAAAQ